MLLHQAQRRSNVLRYHLQLALLDEEAGSGLQIGWEDSLALKEVALPPNLVCGTGGDHPLLTGLVRDAVDGLDGDISHQQKRFDVGEQGYLFAQNG